MYNNFSSKKTKKVISALLASALVVTSAPITASAATKKVVGVGKTVTYKAGATVKKVTVKNKKVVKATISKKNKKNVTLKGVKAGKTLVTIKTSKKTIKLNVCVGATKITKKTLKTTMTAGDKQTVSVTAAGGKGDTITFTSSKKGVLKVNKASAKASAKGIAKMSVAAVSEGTAKLTVASKNTGVKKAFTIKVVAAQPTPASQAPATNIPTSGGGVTGTATTAPTATAGVQATATAAVPGATDATATPGTDVTATPGTDVTATPGADVTATPGTDVTQNPDATVAPTFNPETATQGAITINTNVSGASIKILSGDTTVATVVADATSTSATTSVLAPGEYTAVISKKGYDTYTTTVIVDGDVTITAALTVEKVVGATSEVINQLTGYDNVVLVNDSAIVTVTVKDKDGNLVPNKTVVFSINPEENPARGEFEVKGQNVQVTDANGKASFVIANKANNIKSTSKDCKGSATYTARVLDVTDGTNAVATGCVGFAALELGAVSVDEDMAKLKTKNLVPGENAKGDYGNTTSKAGGIQKSYSLNNDKADSSVSTYGDVSYVNTQQVSAAGKKDREVSFSVTPTIILPSMKVENSNVSDFVQPVNYQSGNYGTYVTDQFDKIIPLDEDASKLQYATLIFNNIQLSEYTELEIRSYTDVDCTTESYIADSVRKLTGELQQKDFGYQIPMTVDADGNTVKAVKVSLKSAGQVETDMNAGYDIKEIRGIYNGANGTASAHSEAITTASVSWETVTPTMSDIQDMTPAAAIALGIIPNDQKSTNPLVPSVPNAATTESKFKYQVPVFPYTGNAVIKEYDRNNKVVAYYLVPTLKSNETATKNTNIINTSKKAYLATEQEATTYLTKGMTTEGNTVTVNSEEVGTTTLKGTITLPGVGSDVLDASNSTVYTSVQWNPIPKAADVTSSSAYLALSGQKITVKAQLTDENGNPVSLSGKQVTYSYDGGDNFDSGDNEKYIGSSIAVVKNESTDINGQATLVLSAADAKSLTGLSASYAGNKYDVKLIVGGQNTLTDTADLYWVNADLSFQKEVGGDKDTTKNDTADVSVSRPTVATPWEYAVETVGNDLTAGTLDGYTVKIDGLKINTSFDSNNKGTYKVVGNGVVDATSDYVNEDVIVNKLTSSSVGDEVTFTATKTDATTYTFKCVGEGTPNLNARMNLKVNWKPAGASLTMINPDGTNIADGTTKIYVKLTDQTGKNPMKNAIVKFKSSNANDIFVENYTTDPDTDRGEDSVANDGIGFTNEDGIVVVELTKAAGVKSSVITASVENVDQVASKTINWVTEEEPFGVVNAAMVEGSDNQIELTFNNEVNADSVRTDLFDLTAEEPIVGGTKTTHYEIKSAKASGKSVILTVPNALAANEYKVDIAPITKDSVEYALTDETGAAATADSSVSFYSTKNATYNVNVSAGTNKNLVKVSQIKAPITLTGVDTDGEVAKYFTVVVDGKIATYTQIAKASGVAGIDVAGTDNAGFDTDDNSFVFAVPFSAEDQSVSVYFMGEKITKTVAANATKATKAKGTADFNKTVKTIDDKLKSQTSGDIDLTATSLLSGSTTLSIGTKGGTAAAAATLTGNKVEIDTDNAAYDEDETITFVATIANPDMGSDDLVKTYTLTVGADGDYEITSVDDDELDADVKNAKAKLASAVSDADVTAVELLTGASGNTNVTKFAVDEDLMGIIALDSPTKITVTEAPNATATFSITYEHAYEAGSEIKATVTKTYKVVCNADGDAYTVTEVE